jgi:hypothetical protein
MADTPAKATESAASQDVQAQIRDLQNTIAAMRAGAPLSLVPEHGAGVGDKVEETWSLAQQEEAKSAS